MSMTPYQLYLLSIIMLLLQSCGYDCEKSVPFESCKMIVYEKYHPDSNWKYVADVYRDNEDWKKEWAEDRIYWDDTLDLTDTAAQWYRVGEGPSRIYEHIKWANNHGNRRRRVFDTTGNLLEEYVFSIFQDTMEFEFLRRSAKYEYDSLGRLMLEEHHYHGGGRQGAKLDSFVYGRDPKAEPIAWRYSRYAGGEWQLGYRKVADESDCHATTVHSERYNILTANWEPLENAEDPYLSAICGYTSFPMDIINKRLPAKYKLYYDFDSTGRLRSLEVEDVSHSRYLYRSSLYKFSYEGEW